MKKYTCLKAPRIKRSILNVPFQVLIVKPDSPDKGITIVEVLVATIVFSVAATVAISLSNTIITSINRTGELAGVNAVIDNDIARIKKIVQTYNACSSDLNGAKGSISTSGCPVTAGDVVNSYAYFPDPLSTSGSGTDVGTFETACSSTSASQHITTKFIDLISTPSVLTYKNIAIAKSGELVGSTPSRVSPSVAEDNTVVVVYRGPGDLKRTIVVTPYLSYWCP